MPDLAEQYRSPWTGAVYPGTWRPQFAATVGSPEYQWNQQQRDIRNAQDNGDYVPQANLSPGAYGAAPPPAAPARPANLGPEWYYDDQKGTWIQDTTTSIGRPAQGYPAPAPAAVPAPTPAPPAAKGPYDSFNAAFQAAYGRGISQDELNSNATLVKLGISNDLFRLLPLDRQMGFDSQRLGLLDNADLQRLIEHNPQVAGGFPTSFWRRFNNDWLAKTVVPFFQQANPGEAANIIRQNGIGGANAGALPPEQRPGLPGGLPGAPSTGTPSVSPPATTPSSPPPAYTGPGEFAIPRAAPPVLSADILSRGALDQFYQNLGYGDFGRTPPPAASPVGARLSGIPYLDEEGNERLIPPRGEQGEPGGGGNQPPSQSPGVGRQWIWDPWRQTWQSETLPREPAPPRGRAPAQPNQAALIGPDLLRDEVQSQIDLRNAQIADLIAKRDQAKTEMETATANRQEANQIAWANLAREIEANLAATQLARDTLIQRQAEFGVEASGMIGSQPTFQREQVINQAELNNKKFQLEAATSAAQIALKQGDQREASRQFDIAQGLKAEIERGQLGLSTEIQRGQLGLATRSQEEAERQGGFGRELEAAKFQFQVQRDPASFVQRAYAARGQQAPPPVAPPAVSFAPVQPPAPPPIRSGPAPDTTRYPTWQPIGRDAPALDETEYIGRPAVTGSPATARLHNAPPPTRNQYATPAQQSFATTLNPLTAAEIKANVGPGLANTLEGKAPGQFFSEVPRLSAQRFNQLLPSERKEYGAAALASGTDPGDLMEEIRRRSQTGTPPPAVTTRTRRAPRASLY